MPYIESSCNGIGQHAIFYDKDQTAGQVAERFCKSCELIVDMGAYGALRAMLENENRIGFRPLEKLFEISILAQLDDHIFRVADRCRAAEK
jgi:hypothetical protein